ncbi:MAG: TonB-dependent receptor, partial [Chitinophagales bacterium]
MKYKMMSCLLLAAFFFSFAHAQEIVKGYVYDENGELLFGANVYTKDKAYGTTTNINGYFELKLPEETYSKVWVSYLGYEEDGRNIPNGATNMRFDMVSSGIIEEVTIKTKKLTRSYINPFNLEKIDGAELTKAACCNIAESFETNAAVDVQFSDAVTGAKKIKMLGLDGIYTQTMFENTPSIRGLSNSHGLLFVPGPFMSGISINKGAGSVTNGYEAITGQINYEYKKPQNSERFYLNLFGSRHGQFEINTNVSHRLSKKVSTMLLVHHANHEFVHDENDDGFQDMPKFERINVMNRWRFEGDKGIEGQLGASFVFDDRESGQFAELTDSRPLYETEVVTRKYDAFAKLGYVFKNQLQSIGTQYKYRHHEQDAWIGNEMYRAREDFANVNFIFQTAMNRQYHSMKLGASYLFDDFRESYRGIEMNRRESVPGVFAEYTFQDNEKLAVVAGLRTDFHNKYGVWMSPRLNVKYNFPKDWIVKGAVGKGYRTANIFAENMGAMVSSRDWEISDDLQGFESAWNVGGSIYKGFTLGFQEGNIAIDYYRTQFTDQVVVDYEAVNKVQIYDLANDGISYANSFQIETSVEAAEGFDIKLAYKLDDVNKEYKSGLKRTPYIPRHKMLATLDYETKNENWRFNLTGQLSGKSRLPSTEDNT